MKKIDLNSVMERFKEQCGRATMFQVNFDEIAQMLPADHSFSDKYTVCVIVGLAPSRYFLSQSGITEGTIEFEYSDNPDLATFLGEIDAHLGQ